MPVVVRRLRPDDDRSKFESGDIDLDRFFLRFAGQNQFKHYLGVTYVALDAERIVGYATVAPSQLEIQALPQSARKQLPKYPLPVLRLARLAVVRDQAGRGIGEQLLKEALLLARRMATELGCIGVVVDAKPNAVSFYKRYGFEALTLVQGFLGDRPQPQPMFLELAAIPNPEGYNHE